MPAPSLRFQLTSTTRWPLPDLGTNLDLEADKLEDAGEVDVVFDVLGGEILDRSAALVRAGRRAC